METPAGRLLALLSLLQARPRWTADELAERLDTTDRTVRRSVARLRELGYPIDSEPGPFGGYRLGRGGALPPLLLAEDEAVAIVVGLRVAAEHGLAGYDDAATAALIKLEAVMPARVREQAAALDATTLPLEGRSGPSVGTDTLMTLASGCRRLERVRFAYVDGSGRPSDRIVEPYQLVHAERRWYLVARDVRRAGAWRTFRLDRVSDSVLTGHRFERGAGDEPDAATMVAEGIALGGYDSAAEVELAAPLEEAASSIPRTVGVLTADGDRTRMRIGGDLDWVARYLIGLPFRFRVLAPDQLRAVLVDIGARLQRDHGA